MEPQKPSLGPIGTLKVIWWKICFVWSSIIRELNIIIEFPFKIRAMHGVDVTHGPLGGYIICFP